ncbi:MAG: DnaJ domain-containing protein [candidate division NC10 bacterium]|nr:DnaJ domain-containing protein [candidate division NC10 bacterium]
MAQRNAATKDYYRILGVSPEATPEEIKRAYRRLALENHPDRNRGDRGAEDRFKAISEAYAVLIDPEKRRQYDAFRQAGFPPGDPGFRYRQEDIFRDVFTDPFASAIFDELRREFQRAGFRFDERFFRQTFFGGRGVVFGGVFVMGPGGFTLSRTFRRHAAQADSVTGERSDRPALSGRLLTAAGRTLKRLVTALFRGDWITTKGSDLLSTITVTADEARHGTKKPVAVQRSGEQEELLVTIPPGVRTGSRLRLRQKGAPGPNGIAGDLYLTIRVEEHP